MVDKNQHPPNMSEPRAMSNIDNEPSDVYAYLEREEFTSEKFKIEVRGLPRYFGIKDFKKLLNEKLRLDLCKVKPPKRGGNWAFVCFRNEEAREHAIKTINGFKWKNQNLSAKKANPAPDPYIKRKLAVKQEQSKKAKTTDDDSNVAELSVEERVRASTTPLWNMPYASQLELKYTQMREVIVNMGRIIGKENRSLSQWIEKRRALNDGLICELRPILSADVTEGYRNKCEFTIGKNPTDDKVVIGFRLSSYVEGSTAVGPVDHLCHVPESMKTAAKIFQPFVQNSGLDVFNPVDQTGFWSQLIARTTRLGHLMLSVELHPQNLTTEALTELKGKIKAFFEEGAGKEANVTSLYFQTFARKTTGGQDTSTIEHLSGVTHIEETLLGLKFRISPLAFFQVNTRGAEILYKTAIDLAQCDRENTSILDICCGTGTIGLCFAKHCSEVLGLEMIADAIKDAKENARINDIDNCDFFVGKAEDIVKAVIQRATKRDVIAIVDPPRAGLHHQALLSLRKTKKVTKLLYISCNPKLAMRNLVDFARPSSKQYLGEPLVPVAAIPVDMFPHTNHCELIVLLERVAPPTENIPVE